jgi:hypothetical protein
MSFLDTEMPFSYGSTFADHIEQQDLFDKADVIGRVGSVALLRIGTQLHSFNEGEALLPMMGMLEPFESCTFTKLNDDYFSISGISRGRQKIIIKKVDSHRRFPLDMNFGRRHFLEGKILGHNQHGFMYQDKHSLAIFYTADGSIARCDPDTMSPPDEIHDLKVYDDLFLVHCHTKKGEHCLYIFNIEADGLRKRKIPLSPAAKLTNLYYCPDTGVQFVLEGMETKATYLISYHEDKMEKICLTPLVKKLTDHGSLFHSKHNKYYSYGYPLRVGFSLFSLADPQGDERFSSIYTDLFAGSKNYALFNSHNKCLTFVDLPNSSFSGEEGETLAKRAKGKLEVHSETYRLKFDKIHFSDRGDGYAFFEHSEPTTIMKINVDAKELVSYIVPQEKNLSFSFCEGQPYVSYWQKEVHTHTGGQRLAVLKKFVKKLKPILRTPIASYDAASKYPHSHIGALPPG